VRLTVLVLACAASVGAQTGFRAPLQPPRATYRIEAAVSPDGQRISGKQAIRLTNTTDKPLRRLTFRWWGNSVEVSNARLVGGDSNGVRLYELQQETRPGDSLEVVMQFEGALEWRNDGAISSFISPRLWWGFQTMDDYELWLNIPAGYEVATSGRLEGDVWRATNVRTFGFFLGRQHESVEGVAGDVQVRVVHPRGAEMTPGVLLRTAVDCVNFYRERFGMYPHRTLSIVPGATFPSGGYPAATGLVVVHGQASYSKRPQNHWRWITAHEIGHEYWSEHVLAAGANSLDWLMIGMGLLADREYRRARGINDGTGKLWRNYVGGVREGLDTTIDVTSEQEQSIKWDFNNVVEHGKSMAMVNALEDVMGSKAFDAFYRRLLREYKGRQFDWRQLRHEAEAETGENLGWFFDQWVRSARHLQFGSSHQCTERHGTFACSITVERKGTMSMPVTVAARFEDGTEQRLRTDRLPKTQDLQVIAASRIHEIVIDPDGALAMAEPPGEAVRVLRSKVSDLPWTSAADKALTLFDEASSLRVADEDVWVKLAMTLFDGGHYEKAMAALAHLEPNFFRLVWEGNNFDMLGRRADAVQRYQRALSLAAKPTMRSDQYRLVIDEAWVRERLTKPFTRE